MPKTKKGHFRGIFGKNTPFSGPKSCVLKITLVSLVGVGTYEKILRPTQNPTLACMDPLTKGAVSTEPGDPYLSRFLDIYYNVSVHPIVHPHLLGSYFNACN